MEFDLPTTAITFTILLAILIAGTAMSPMTTSTVVMVSVGLILFGLLSLIIGVKHGEHRASQ
jgi:hypothetical protein